MAGDRVDEPFVELYERMNAWMLQNDPEGKLGVVDWGVVPQRGAVVVEISARDARLELRLRTEVGERLDFEVRDSDGLRPLQISANGSK